jgi:hypothetical protein
MGTFVNNSDRPVMVRVDEREFELAPGGEVEHTPCAGATVNKIVGPPGSVPVFVLGGRDVGPLRHGLVYLARLRLSQLLDDLSWRVHP